MASTQLDFAALLSRNHRPARVTHLTTREAFRPNDKKSRKGTDKLKSVEERYNSDHNRRAEDESRSNAEATKLVMKLVSKTPTYARHLESPRAKRAADDIVEEMVASVPKPPKDEWRTLPPSLHGVELGDWAKNISWEGLSKNKSKNNNKKKQNTEPADAVSLLAQRRNPYLDALILDDSNISWGGSKEDNIEKAKNIPLILELGTAGQSIARHVLPVSRPTPFGRSDAYLQRYQREWSRPVTSTAEISKGSLHADKEKMAALIEARQKKRAQMAKDKTTRVTEAMGTLQLGGGKGRTITSSLMGPGGTERTGRPSRHQGSSSAHDAEFIEQLDMVYNHVFSKPELSVVELRQYHRPKLPKGFVRRERSWQFQIRYIPSTKKADSTSNPSSYQSMMMGSHAGEQLE